MVSDPFDTTFQSTIGIDFKIKTTELGGKKIKLQIWDTAGQERYHATTTAYYRGAMGIMLIYSIDSGKTFDSISAWLRNISEYANPDVQKVLVGNNCELEDKRQVPREKGEQLAALHGIPFIETSTVNNINVEKAFLVLAQAIFDQLPEKEPEIEVSATVKLRPKNGEERNKCV